MECARIPTIHAFGPFRLDADAEILFRGSEPMPVGKRAVALLRVLVERAGAPVSKDTLIDAAWSGLAVEESNLTVQIAALRRALGEVPGGEGWIVTLPRRGYRFVGPVVTKSDDLVLTTSTVDPAAKVAPMTALALPDKPSIAVLPFANMSGDPEQEYFADGMVEDILTALSRVRWLFVIARQSSFSYKGRAVDVKQIGRELGVRYVTEGSVRKFGNRVRVTAQLIDAETGAHLWADRFEGMLEDVFELQDDIASSVAGAIEPTLQTAEHRRSIRRPTNDLTAYDLVLRARTHAYSWEKQDLMRAFDLFGQALKRDSHYGRALAGAALGHTHLDVNFWSEDLQKSRQIGVSLARRALEAAGDDAEVLGDVAHVLGYFEPEIDPAISLIDRALKLSPSYAIGWTRSGWLRLWAGQPDIAIEHFEESLRLNPMRRAPASFGIAVAHFFARRLEKAAAMLSLSVQETPSWAPCYRFLASCYAHLGRLEDAHSVVGKLRHITPVLVQGAEHWRIQEDRDFYLEGLRLAIGKDEPASP